MQEKNKRRKSKRLVKRSWCTIEPKYYKNPHTRIKTRGQFRETKSRNE